ncbi:MAG: helix-turn-helix domain-containing protein [Rhizobiales bacterium]|nr:helix-turn-helix domain-containing protein [Hyphomicrobiales bacterium]
MELVALKDMMPTGRQQYPVEEWSEKLRGICGRFQPMPVEASRLVTGAPAMMLAGGLELACIANDLDVIRRDRQDIRADYGESLFLLLQLEGVCGIEQYGRQSIIAPGDCILVDSASPSVFHFGGRFSNHLSVHLPRQIMLSAGAVRFEVSRRLMAGDPMAAMLRALVAKLAGTDADDRRAPPLRQLLFDATRQAFAADDQGDRARPSDSASGRLDVVQILIDRHLTDEQLTPQWLADRVGISLRTLQDDFSTLGTTATSLIRARRLHLARDRLRQVRPADDGLSIAEIAYSSGFNDISYFNRCFKRAFDCSPRDLLPH